jgi:hypothetical protein
MLKAMFTMPATMPFFVSNGYLASNYYSASNHCKNYVSNVYLASNVYLLN